ncbi:FAD-dependent monooxygenase [Lysobacter auxotrophicus]|uniref:FAD-dependent monooxygenase n=1 Tax=Lysobacter auxotrophicus TaxID=2992573 RepID=A0ABM8DI92_9GAMM|nr:FAD-dependent monooxygenase [Lysobacter auxotrophicus]BDU18129.1 FAD-dependent monooxygenase [Lysobacter auxotrophicus]
MSHLDTQVLIVGAGPAGMSTAIGLAQQEVDFTIIDALPEAQNTSRAAVIHAATLESVRELQIADALISRGLKVPFFRVRDRDQDLLRVEFSGLPAASPYALMIPQDETEQILTDRLAAAGRRVDRLVRLTELTRGRDHVVAACEGPKGECVIRAQYIVGADGMGSTVREQSGIAFPGKTYGSFLLADVRMEWPLSRDEVSLFFSGEGTLVVAPMSQDRYRVVAQLEGATSIPTTDDVQALIDERGPCRGVRIHELLWGSRFQVHHRLAATFRDGPVLLVGDAAHVHSPAGGQGMNLGIRDAVALSTALGESIRVGSDEPLDSYNETRRTAATKVLAMTDRLTRLATIRSPAARWIRNHLIDAAGRSARVRAYAAQTLAGFA